MERDNDKLFSEIKDEIRSIFNGKQPNCSNKIAHVEANSSSGGGCTQPIHKVRCNSISEDIQCLRADLMESYEAILKAKNTLDSITFLSIGNRIKDLYLPLHDCTENQIKSHFSAKDYQHNFTSVGAEDQFDLIDEDYGGIPELQLFFKVCSHLKFYMDNILVQTKRFEELNSLLTKNVQGYQMRTKLMKQMVEKNKHVKNND